MVQRQLQQKNYHDQHTVDRSLEVQDRVFLRNYGRGLFWLPGVITAITGPLSYECQIVNGRTVCRHQDQIRKREVA